MRKKEGEYLRDSTHPLVRRVCIAPHLPGGCDGCKSKGQGAFARMLAHRQAAGAVQGTLGLECRAREPPARLRYILETMKGEMRRTAAEKR